MLLKYSYAAEIQHNLNSSGLMNTLIALHHFHFNLMNKLPSGLQCKTCLASVKLKKIVKYVYTEFVLYVALIL